MTSEMILNSISSFNEEEWKYLHFIPENIATVLVLSVLHINEKEKCGFMDYLWLNVILFLQ